MSKNDDLKRAEDHYRHTWERSLTVDDYTSLAYAEGRRKAYAFATAEMHEQLTEAIEYLSSAIGSEFVPDRIKDLLLKAKSL